MTPIPAARTRAAAPKAQLKTSVALIALLAALPAHAQEAEDENTYRLAPILVDAAQEADNDAQSVVAKELWVGGKVATSVQDTPASVSVITQKEAQMRDATTVEELLSYSPGILADYYGSDDRNDYYLIRGFQATSYRDGLTLGSMRGVREEPYAYARTEVLRGANSALFGAADPGGAVNFVTKTPQFDRIAESQVTFGSNARKEVAFDYGNANADDTLAFRLTGKLADSALEYDTSRDDERFLMGGVTWAPSADTEASLIVDYLKRDGTPNSGGYPLDKEYDRSLFFGEEGLNDHNVDRKSVTALFKHDFGTGLSLRSNLRYSDLTDDFAYIYLYDFAGRTGTSLNRYYFGTDRSAEEVIGNAMLQYDASFGTLDSSTIAGVEFRDATQTDVSVYGAAGTIDLATGATTGIPANRSVYANSTTDYSTQSLFATQNFSWDDRWITTFGLRHDWLDVDTTNNLTNTASSGDFSENSGRAALTYKFDESLSAYASYVESVAPPTIGVDPERGEQVEIGVKYAPLGSNTLISASVYDLSKQNVTVAVTLPSGVIERQRIGEQRTRGFDFEAKAEINDALTLLGSYSYMDSEVVKGVVRGTDVSGKAFASTPNHIASLWAKYDLPSTAREMSLGLGLRYVGSYYFDALNTKKSQGATLVDMGFDYELAENTALALNVSNLFDEQHVVGSGTADYYNPGREIALTLRKSW